MRRRILSIVVLLPAITLVAATCVGETHQHGPAGPWVGEVVNHGTEPAAGVAVRANIFDASGAYLGLSTAFSCPATLAPGGHGTFEIFLQSYAYPPGGVVLPLRAEFEQPALEGQDHAVTGDGLSTRILSHNTAKRVAVIEVQNESTKTFNNTVVCANLRDASGSLLEVGSTRLFPTVLRPGETQTVPVFFNSMPPGEIELFAQGDDVFGSAALVFDPAEFQITATRITNGPGGRALVVAGEMPNRSGQDITRVRLMAHAEGAPETRVTSDLGCGGTVAFGSTAAATFAIPLDPGITDAKPVIVGIEAMPSRGDYAVPTSDLSLGFLPDQPDGLGSVAVGATLRNPTSKWLDVHGACATVRDRIGRAIGVVQLRTTNNDPSPYLPLVPPGATAEVTGVGYVLDTPASADVQAYGELRDQGPVVGEAAP
jgi:hypothetical protein